MMISAFHLLWIVPLSSMFGFMTAAILSVGGREENSAITVNEEIAN